MRLPVAAGFALLAPLLTGPAAAQDFRKTTWGMSQAEVRAAEPAQPASVRTNRGEVILEYDPVPFAGLAGRMVYIFARDRLVRAKYIFAVEHANQNDYIADFKTVEPVLLENHGKPARERAIWEDDATQDEPKSYLDQDRATPSSILPSDRYVGLAVALGHLRLYAEWNQARSTIVHALSGKNLEIVHQVEYRSRELERIEEQVRGETPARN